MTINEQILKELDYELTKEIRSRQDYILEKLRVRLNQESYSFQRFNGLLEEKTILMLIVFEHNFLISTIFILNG